MRKPFDGDFRISQTFGNDLVINGVHIYKQWGYKGHNGIDYAVPTGTNLLAPHKGTVKEALFDADGYGWYVKIENDEEGSVMGHMMTLKVKYGDVVEEGQLIGISDNTGNSTGPHLHWGYYRIPRNRDNGYGGFIDQIPYLSSSPTPNIPSVDQVSTIKAFLIEKGYTDPNTHLEVIKVMYESDLKLKSGNYITKEVCANEKDALSKNLKEGFEAEKTEFANTLANEYTIKQQEWEIKKKSDIIKAVNDAITATNNEWMIKNQVNDKVLASGEYKFAQLLFKLLHLKGG